MNYNHVSATIGTRAVDPRMFADDKFLKRMSNFDRVCKQIDAKHDHVMEMLANIQEQLRNLEMKQRRENGVKFCAGDAQFQNQKAAIKPTPSLSPLFSTFQPSPQTPPPPLLTTLKKPYSIETPSAKPLITALSSQIETLAILCTPKPQNIAMVVVNPKAIEPPLISSAYADITEGSNGALVIKEFHESSLDVSGNREKIETNLVEIGVQAMEEMSEWVVVSDSARSAEQTNPSREILQQIKASPDTKKTKCSQAIHLVKRITFNRSSISTETIHRFLSGQFLHSRILAEWAEEPPGIPNYQPSPFKGKPNTLQEKMATKILVISPMLNVFDEMTERDLSSSKEMTVCMDLGEKIHAHMKTDLYRVSVATSVEDFGKKCNEAMQVFDPGGSALDVRVLKVGDSLLEVFYASWLRIKWDSKKIYDWVWQSLFICSHVWQHNLLKCSGMNREIVLCIVTSKSNIFGLVGCNICWFKTTCLVLYSKNLLAVTPHARTRRICFYTFMELTVWKWLKDGIGTCLQIDSLSLARLCEICDSLFEMLPIWNKHLRSVKFKIMEPNPLEYCVVTPDFEIFCEGEPSKKKDENRMDEVCYDGVWGLRKQMARVRELVELPLRHPQFFKSIDDKPPMRILLYGPLESENTLIVANEMGVSFFVIYGHEIISNLAGEGENNLRGTFEEAEKNAPSIILIDEIYTIAPKRWKISGGILKSMTSEGETSLAKAIADEDSIATHRGSSSRDASGIADIKLKQLLIELDGLFENEGVHTMRRVMKMMLGFHSNIRITQSDLLVNILGTRS